MGGRESLRGYLVQMMASLFEMLGGDNDWEAVSLEPLHESEKVDIKWRYSDHVKVVQIKSSQNPFRKKQIEAWCKELVNSTKADQYELLLVGRYSSKIGPSLIEFEGVTIPSPKPLDIELLIKGISFDLSDYCNQRGIPIQSPPTWKILVYALLTKLEVTSIYGQWLSRNDFDSLIQHWIFTLFPKIQIFDPDFSIDDVKEALIIHTFQPETWFQALKVQSLESDQNKRITLLEALNQDEKIVLVGTSGSGKTTLMRTVVDEFNRDPAKLCYWIPLISYTQSLDHTLKRLLGWYEISDDKTIPTLQRNGAILLFDGLNEVTEADREQCKKEIEQLFYSYKGQICISLPLSDRSYYGFDYSTYVTCSLTKMQIEQAIKEYFRTKGEPNKATWFLQSVRGWDYEKQQDFDTLAQTPINLQFLLELIQSKGFIFSGHRDLHGQVIQKRLERTRRHDQRGKIAVDIKTECLMDLAYQSIIEDQSLQIQKAFVRTVFSEILSQQDATLALEEIIRSGLLLDHNEFLVDWPHASFRDYLAGRKLFDLVETRKAIAAFPFDKLSGVAAAAHATRLLTIQSCRPENRSLVFHKLLQSKPRFEVMKTVAEEFHVSTAIQLSNDQDLCSITEAYVNMKWGERFLTTYHLIKEVAQTSGFSGVDQIPTPKGLIVYFNSDADFCAMLLSGENGIHFDQLDNFQRRASRLKKRKKASQGFCLYSPFLFLLDPEIVAYIQVGAWLRLRAKEDQPILDEWHNNLAAYTRPKSEWISWELPDEIPDNDFNICANPHETLNFLNRVLGSEKLDSLRRTVDILTQSRCEMLSWNEIYMPITFQIDTAPITIESEAVSNRLGQVMVLKPQSSSISLVLLMRFNPKIDYGISIFVPFPVPFYNRYYLFASMVMSGLSGLSFVHLRG